MFILEQFRNHFISFSHQVRVCWGPPFATMTIAQLWFYIDFPLDFVWFWAVALRAFCDLVSCNWVCPLCSGCHGTTPFAGHWFWVWVVPFLFVHSMLSSWRSNINQLVWQFNLVILKLNCLQHGLVLVFVNFNSTCFDVFGSKLNLL